MPIGIPGLDFTPMPFDLKNIETLAPDQASLGAAAKLAKAAKWARLEREGDLYWGECQGSGANPYRVIADASDHGYKCTCPSRKFPCKHTLALMWLAADNIDLFQTAAPPQWVVDWLGRRRRAAPVDAEAAAPPGAGGKSIAAAVSGEGEAGDAAPQEDAKAVARREAAQKKRAEDTRLAIAGALEELEQWITDQLRLGLAALLDNAAERCRRIAARMVDQKAGALASRIDEMPARLLALRNEERPEAVLRELGKLVLLSKAWRQNPDDPEIRRHISTAETREQVLADTRALVVKSTWEVLGERIETRRDGLVRHATWLMNLHAGACRHALLLDFYPASAGRRSESFAAGEQFTATLVFYPSRAPLRALIAERAPLANALPWPAPESPHDPLAACAPFWDALPWELECPLNLPAGRILKDGRGQYWWQAEPPQGALG
ncbi:MAG: SWIM zinc finger family protein, partial [Zoogloeaceae bacterium]|nr:SWIM zinc finger family protein [Zoogloeaceae bacterium]